MSTLLGVPLFQPHWYPFPKVVKCGFYWSFRLNRTIVIRQFREHNPLVRVALALGGILSISLAGNVVQVLYIALVFLVLCQLLGVHLRPIWHNIRMMLPWATLFFLIHIFFIDNPQTEFLFVSFPSQKYVISDI